jgi:hypothetical protein
MFGTTGINCRSAVREPELTLVSVRREEVSCTNADAKDEASGTGTVGGMIQELSTEPGDFGITSVWSRSVWLNDSTDVERAGRILPPRPLLCPGAPVPLIRYTLMYRSEVDVTVTQLQLPDFERFTILLRK